MNSTQLSTQLSDNEECRLWWLRAVYPSFEVRRHISSEQLLALLAL